MEKAEEKVKASCGFLSQNAKQLTELTYTEYQLYRPRSQRAALIYLKPPAGLRMAWAESLTLKLVLLSSPLWIFFL